MKARVVWKFPVGISAIHTVHEIPTGARLLHVEPRIDGSTRRIVDLWFEVEPGAPKEERVFRAFDTGDTGIRDDYEYRGTTQQGVWVWHVYERIG